jgi:Fe-S cluster assembly scaffold protein SufB
MSDDSKILNDIGEYKYGFHDRDDNYAFKSRKGLDRQVVEQISQMKGEPQWMLDFRLKALEHFQKRPMPNWGPSLQGLDLNNIYYYVKPTEKSEKSWDDVPDDIKRTFDKLGVPEAERKFLAGLGAQYESEMVYHSIQEHLEKQGVIFLSIEDGLRKHPDLFREYFGTVIPIEDNKFAALNSAVWSGGSFVYVPKGVKVDLPLQAYFRLNTANVGQFERSLIIVDEGAQVHYVEGCFVAGARVQTRWGEKAIQEIAIGDEVLTHLGRYRHVYHVQKRPYHGNIYTISYLGGEDSVLNVTSEHPLLVLTQERASQHEEHVLAWKMASDVRVGDYLVTPISEPEAVPADGLPIAENSASWRSLPAFQSNDAVRRDDFYNYRPITKIVIREDETEVYNFSVDEDESYVCEGVVSHNCTAPQYTTDSFHSGVIEIIVKKGARSRYSTIQNWSTNVYNLVTQRAKVFENGTHEWVDANIGSKVTMKYPSCYLMEPGAHGEMLSMAFAGPGQIQDAGSKMVHFAPNTSSKITSKSISKAGGRASYRGLLKVHKGAKGVKSSVVCDALLLDPQSRSDTYPYIEIDEDDVTVGHEASVSKVGEEQLFYLMSRGLSEEEATTMVVSGFIEPLVKELPMEYAVEMNRLIALQMEGSIG